MQKDRTCKICHCSSWGFICRECYEQKGTPLAQRKSDKRYHKALVICEVR